MLNLVAALVPGKPVAIQLRRESKNLEIQVTVGKRPTQQRRRR
jgi:S1-C subfamily serine protease